jgi:ADP-dependent phosphofructokinase/glucokinase
MTTLCMYNTKVDAVYTVSGATLGKIVLEGNTEQVSTPKAFFAALTHCMKTGDGAEVLITKSTADFLRNVFPWTFQVGGNARNIANNLAALGERPVLNVLAPTLRQMATLAPRVLVPRDGRLVPPNEATVASGRVTGGSLVHYLCQFRAGDRVTETVIVPCDNRLIATNDVPNSRMIIDPDFLDFVSKNKILKAILSGFHLCSRFYLEQAVEQVDQLADVYTHAELGCSQYPDDFDWFVSHLSVSSLGMNENEFSQLVGEEPNWFNVVENIASVSDAPRVCVHTKDFVMSFLRNKKDPEKEIEALDFGVKAVAKTVAKHNLSLEQNAEGVRVRDAFCSCLDGRRHRSGSILKLAEGILVVVPAYSVKAPSHSVGLGDTFTAAVFSRNFN